MKSGYHIKSLTAVQMCDALKEDLHGFLDTFNLECSKIALELGYKQIQVAAHLARLMGEDKTVRREAIAYVKRNYTRMPSLLDDVDIAMQCVMSANDDNSRRDAARKAKAIRKLLNKNVKPEDIAQRLVAEGGVHGVSGAKAKAKAKAAAQAAPNDTVVGSSSTRDQISEGKSASSAKASETTVVRSGSKKKDDKLLSHHLERNPV